MSASDSDDYLPHCFVKTGKSKEVGFIIDKLNNNFYIHFYSLSRLVNYISSFKKKKLSFVSK